MLHNKKSRLSIKFISKILLLFCFIYPFSLRIIGLPESIHASRVAAILFIVLSIFTPSYHTSLKSNAMYSYYKKIVILVLFTCLYTLIISIVKGLGQGSNYLSIALDNIIFSIIPIFAIYRLFDDVDEFVDAIIGATTIQSAAILFSTFVPVASLFFNSVFNNFEHGYGDRDLELLSQSYASGIACFTSEGVTRFSIGLVMCMYKYITTNKSIILILYLVFSVCNSMLARTGMLFSIIGLLFIVAYLLKTRRLSFSILLSFMAVGLIGLLVLSNQSSDFYDRFNRYGEFKEGGISDFFTAYFGDKNTEIPTLSFSTLFGTSIISGVSADGVRVNVDGGFIKNYVALGLILSCYVYIYILKLCLRIKKAFTSTEFRYVLMFYTVYLFMSEFKEYFILFRGSLCMFLIFVMLGSEKNIIKNGK